LLDNYDSSLPYSPVLKEYPLKAIADAPQVSLNDGHVKYIGKINPEGLFKLKTLTKDRYIHTLTIASSGGEISIGIAIGLWVHAYNLDVVVEKACMSACANYIFPAGRRKIITPGAVVAWHGSATQPHLRDESNLRRQVLEGYAGMKRNVPDYQINREVKQYISYIDDVRREQDGFYRTIKVDEYVTRIGIEEYGIKGFFFLSVKDMNRFGITNIFAPANYEKVNVKELKKAIKLPVVYIKLKQVE
jgi:hypothetical protein